MDNEEEKDGLGDYVEGLTQEQLADLKAKNAISVSRFKGDPFVFKAPSDVQWFRCFDDMQNDKRSTAIAMKTLVIETCLYPSRETLVQALASSPPVTQKFFAETVEAAGLNDSEPAKKL